jgi:hypothetical protein
MRNHVEPTKVALRTTAAAEDDPHTHVAVFNASGNGYTDEAEDGHAHRIRELEVQPANGHTHELTAVRAELPEHARELGKQAAPAAGRAAHRQRRQVA